MTCKDVIDILSEYLEEALDATAVASLEQHLRDCPPCVAYLRTFRKSHQLAGQVSQAPMPPEMKQRLRSFLAAQLRDSVHPLTGEKAGILTGSQCPSPCAPWSS